MGTRIYGQSNYGEEREGVAGHDGGWGVGEPEEGDGDGDARNGDLLAQDGVKEKGDPGGGEEFGVGGALVCGEEHVGVHHVERCGDEGGSGSGEVAGQAVQGEAAAGEGEPGVDDGCPGPREDEAEDGAGGPGERWVEDEARFASVPCWSVGPVRVEVAVGELAGGFEPTEDVEVEVVAAGAAVYQEGNDGQERGYGDQEVG